MSILKLRLLPLTMISTFQVFPPPMAPRNAISLHASSTALLPMVRILLVRQQALKCPRFWQLLRIASQAGQFSLRCGPLPHRWHLTPLPDGHL